MRNNSKKKSRGRADFEDHIEVEKAKSMERKYDLRFSGNGQKCPSSFEKTQVPLE